MEKGWIMLKKKEVAIFVFLQSINFPLFIHSITTMYAEPENRKYTLIISLVELMLISRSDGFILISQNNIVDKEQQLKETLYIIIILLRIKLASREYSNNKKWKAK